MPSAHAARQHPTRRNRPRRRSAHWPAFPVTQAWYAEVTGRRPSRTPGDRLPVESVSWWDAARFCALSRHAGLTPAYHFRTEAEGIEWDASAEGYRLPTEAEWEHCRVSARRRSHPTFQVDDVGFRVARSVVR
ncbi:SUMF1/EgtB/PvdO family nonheme iron enzyme [Streptomyces sp. NPDC004311]|uniref:SUMF1/EgtB/PvdO family nonheme iron enzyme n=1 Tax=Streptomyces sp. NPDC004311 TaxID=3364698 RepID=UPI00368D17AD